MQQRRDVGSEVIVALAVIGMLALALTFGVVLTLSRTVATQTAIPSTAEANATGTSVAILSGTAAATMSSTEATELSTTEPTEAPTSTRAILAATEAATQAATEVATEIATEAVTEAVTDTATPIATQTPTYTATATASATAVPSDTPTATQTNTQTNTATSTATFTDTATNTPTDTSTPTLAPSATPTPTPSAVIDQGILPTNTSLPTATGTITPTLLPTLPIATSCVSRIDWIAYTIQQGDTLFSIARQAHITLAELQQANCISNPNTIVYGRVIVVPPGTVILTNTPTGPNGSGNANLCPDANIRITSPIAGSSFSGIITFNGTARVTNFASYEIEFQPEGSNQWVRTAYSSSPVTNGYLGRLDPNPSQLPAGKYTIRLRINVTSGNIPTPCVITLRLVR